MKRRALAATMAAALIAAMGGSASAGTDTGAPGIQPSTPSPSTFTSYGGIRLRAIGSLANTPDEYLGVADLAPAANRIEANFTVPRFATNMNSGSANGDCIGNYGVGTLATPASNQISLAWDRTAGTLTSRLVNPSLDCTIVFRNFAQELANAEGWTLARAQSALGDVNALRVMVDGRQAGSGIALRGVTVDGTVPLGPFDPGSGSRQDWLGSGYDFDAPNGFNVSGSLELGGSFAICEDTCALEIKFGHVPPLNRAPVVQDHASDVTGLEGDTLTTDGSFTDPDGDALTISGSGAGTVADLGNGRWSWHHVPPDDGNGSVVVTASDGNGGTATDVFSWRSDNVPPSIVSLTPSTTTALAGSDVTWTATATDPGTADTFTWWFDGGAGAAAGLTTTYTRTYADCGTYSLDAKVADDDGGSDSATSRATVTVGDGVVLPPLGSGGKDLVQTGQVVPVKVRVGCDGAFWGGLAPTIALVHGDATSPGVSVAAAGEPGVMRELDGMYLSNLRIPSSVGSHDLIKGDELTIRVQPFGSAGGALDIVVEIRK